MSGIIHNDCKWHKRLWLNLYYSTYKTLEALEFNKENRTTSCHYPLPPEKANSSRYGVTTITDIAPHILCPLPPGRIFCVCACVDTCFFDSPGTKVNGPRAPALHSTRAASLRSVLKSTTDVWSNNQRRTHVQPVDTARSEWRCVSVRVGARCFYVSILPACVLLSQARPLSVSLRLPPLSLCLSLSCCSSPGRLYFLRRRHSYAADAEARSCRVLVLNCFPLLADWQLVCLLAHWLSMGAAVHTLRCSAGPAGLSGAPPAVGSGR